MLVLARFTGERLILTVPPSATPTEIVMQIIEVDHKYGQHRVKVGTDAPRYVTVDREEISKGKAEAAGRK